MKFVETRYFLQQLQILARVYHHIIDNYTTRKKEFDPKFAVHLWRQIYKSRYRNSSIQSGKRWWLRIITKIYNDKVLPILIYSKTTKENVTDKEIIQWLEMIYKELEMEKLEH